MAISANLTLIANGYDRITSEEEVAAPGMSTWEIDVMNQYCHIVDRQYHTGWFQEEAERIARERCSALHESSWQVIRIGEWR